MACCNKCKDGQHKAGQHEGGLMHPCIAQPDLQQHRDCLFRQMCKDDSSRVDFAMAEVLAFGTLALRRGVRPAGVTPSDYFSMDPSLGLNRGHYAVRLSGQDSERGTFNQRHAALYDQVTGER